MTATGRSLILVLLFLTLTAAVSLMAIGWITTTQQPVSETPGNITLATSSRVDPAAVPALAALQAEINHLVRASTPSVVSVTTTTLEETPALPPVLERYFGRRAPREFERKGLGSGVIVSQQGHIVTNHHVIAGVDAISIALNNGRTVEAQVVATDPSADLAIIRVHEPDLEPLPLGDSDAVSVGDLVLAIGNPFGLEATVTNGIISATERRISQDTWVDFLQTNAEINPGNSGGPLINIHGEVIGINTAIAATRAGGWQGVGFAVPSSAVHMALTSLQRHGRIVRPHLGVVVQELTEELAREIGVEGREGVLVREVPPEGPASRAGIRPGDIIVRIANQPVRDAGDLRRHIRPLETNTAVPVEIVRDGKRLTVQATIAEAPREDSRR